jgi:hypothetical protein
MNRRQIVRAYSSGLAVHGLRINDSHNATVSLMQLPKLDVTGFESRRPLLTRRRLADVGCNSLTVASIRMEQSV